MIKFCSGFGTLFLKQFFPCGFIDWIIPLLSVLPRSLRGHDMFTGAYATIYGEDTQ